MLSDLLFSMDKFYPGINEIIIAFSIRHKIVLLYLNVQQKLNTTRDTEKTGVKQCYWIIAAQ